VRAARGLELYFRIAPGEAGDAPDNAAITIGDEPAHHPPPGHWIVGEVRLGSHPAAAFGATRHSDDCRGVLENRRSTSTGRRWPGAEPASRLALIRSEDSIASARSRRSGASINKRRASPGAAPVSSSARSQHHRLGRRWSGALGPDGSNYSVIFAVASPADYHLHRRAVRDSYSYGVAVRGGADGHHHAPGDEVQAAADPERGATPSWGQRTRADIPRTCRNNDLNPTDDGDDLGMAHSRAGSWPPTSCSASRPSNRSPPHHDRAA